MDIKTIFLPVFDNLSKFTMLVAIFGFSKIFTEKYRSKLDYLASAGLALTVALLGFNGYSEYPNDFDYSIIIFFTVLIPSCCGVYWGLRRKEETLNQLIYTRRYFHEYRILSDQEIVGIFRELYPKLAELTDAEIIAGLESKYSSAPVLQQENDIFTLLPYTRKKFPEFKNLSDKHMVSVFKEKFPELKDSLDISAIMFLEKKYVKEESSEKKLTVE